MRERDIEQYLCARVESMRGRAYKFVSPGNAGVPDRLVCLPGGVMFFVELKAPGQKLRPSQGYKVRELTRLGCSVYIADSKTAVDELLEKYVNRGDAE